MCVCVCVCVFYYFVIHCYHHCFSCFIQMLFDKLNVMIDIIYYIGIKSNAVYMYNTLIRGHVGAYSTHCHQHVCHFINNKSAYIFKSMVIDSKLTTLRLYVLFKKITFSLFLYINYNCAKLRTPRSPS